MRSEGRTAAVLRAMALGPAVLGMAAGLTMAGSTAARAATAHVRAPAPAPAFVRMVDGTGNADLAQPFAVAAAKAGTVWVADRGRGRVEHLTPAGRVLAVFGGRGQGRLDHPEGVAVDRAGHVWVADTGRDRIVEFSARGAQLAVIGATGPGRLNEPAAVAVAPAGPVYVADQGNNRIEEFSATGTYLRSIPVPAPQGVAVTGAGDVWVSSAGYAVGSGAGDTVREFSPSGRRLRSFGKTQSGYGALSDPAGIAVTRQLIYVAQPDYGLVTVFRPGGRFYTEFGLRDGPRAAAQNLAFPQAVAAGPGGRIWVADTGDGRVAEFGAAGSLAAAPGGVPVLPWVIGAAVLLLIAGLTVMAIRRRASATARTTTEAVLTRRRLLAGASALTGAGLGGAVLPPSLRRALAATSAAPSQASLRDIQHIVILMQENRSFDHYFGTMPGVRGFADPAAIRLPGGKPVFYQPDPSHRQGYLLPFHYDTATTSAQATPGLDHSWPTQHQAWNGGRMDRWIAAKGPHTMGYFTRDDIPFHWALAEAFTLCDNYHCSVLGATDPNRCYMMSGTIDPAGHRGGPVTTDRPTFRDQVVSWTTYPERLQRAGISWQVYQEEDNYDNNALAWFTQYRRAPRSSPLQTRGMTRRPAGTFEQDARGDRLPQVSWLVAPSAQSEHPRYFPAAGAEYIAQKLEAIASNPAVWAKTAFILCYDENDGLFDHVPPPVPPPGTADEFVGGEPIGLGFRVPATIVSPWTAGGFVCSDVFDHTSLIRLIESRFGVREPNISAWRRRTCGDLTSAFRFGGRPARYPYGNARLRLARAEADLLTAQRQVNDNPRPRVPRVNQPLPGQ